jgi:hypothetical protein
MIISIPRIYTYLTLTRQKQVLEAIPKTIRMILKKRMPEYHDKVDMFKGLIVDTKPTLLIFPQSP